MIKNRFKALIYKWKKATRTSDTDEHRILKKLLKKYENFEISENS